VAPSKDKGGKAMSQIKVEKMNKEQLQQMGVYSWPIWEKEKSEFDWSYDSQEQCYFLAGKVNVKTNEGNVQIGVGDFVTFPKGLACVWEVQEPVRKHYNFK